MTVDTQKLAELLTSISAQADEYLTLDGLDIDAGKEKIIGTLVDTHEWTGDSAKIIYNLVERYGLFMLKSAVAIAFVLDVEDGSET